MKKLLTLILLLPFSCIAQSKWFSKNDIPVCSIEIGAGYMQGWRDEVLYHPNALFRHFPRLAGKFFDNRIQSKPGLFNMEWNADHLLKTGIVLSHLSAICIRISERKKFKYILADMAKYYVSYQTGFFLSYNVTHKNKF